MRRVSIDTVRAAATRVYTVAARTPLVRLDPLSRSTPEIFLKLEIFQPIGSFKIRGAMNAIAQLPAEALRDGVWTVSAGNAAQGVALAAREAGARASVLVMDGAPATKLAAIERLGASIVTASFDEAWTAVETHHSDRMTGRMVHPFDDDDFISGNGTCGLEILEDLPDVDAVVAPMGGGGLLSGIGTVMRALRPEARVYAAEPENAAPLRVSLAAGKPMRYENWSRSWVDGAGGQSVLATMWPIVAQNVDEVDRRDARRGGEGDEARRGTVSRHRRRRRRLRHGCGALAEDARARPQARRRGRLRRQHRSLPLCQPRGCLRVTTSR